MSFYRDYLVMVRNIGKGKKLKFINPLIIFQNLDLIYVATLFVVLHIGNRSLPHTFFTFGVGLFFG